MNYRLGAFGFLATEDKAAVGNMGILDQILALKWVKANIENFGGDPNKVSYLWYPPVAIVNDSGKVTVTKGAQ